MDSTYIRVRERMKSDPGYDYIHWKACKCDCRSASRSDRRTSRFRIDGKGFRAVLLNQLIFQLFPSSDRISLKPNKEAFPCITGLET